MKRILLFTCVLVYSATMALAGPGTIGIFADPAGMNCNLPDPGPQLTMYYIVHVGTTGAAGVTYSAPKPTCSTAMWLSDANKFSYTVGSSHYGVTVYYDTACRVGSIHVQTIVYITDGLTPNCCNYPVLPNPMEGRLAAVTCDFETWVPITGGIGIVNAGPTCNCDVPLDETTWGNVKALYAE